MTVRRSPLARWGLLGLALLGLGLETGCSEFRARRRIGRSPAASARSPAATPLDGAETPIIEGEIITPPVGSPASSTPPLGRTVRPAAPSTVGEPALNPDPLPTIGASPASGRADSLHSSGAVIPTSVSGVTLQPPIPSDPASQPATFSPTASGRPAGLIRDDRPTPPSAVVAEARAALDALTSYQLNLHRQERVNGTLLPAEDLVMGIRRHPLATRLTWVDGPHQGREVLYRADEPGGQMHIQMGQGKFPVSRMAIAPTNPLVMKNSRHPITEAGLDPLVASLEAADRSGTLVDLGMQMPAPLDRPHRGLSRRSPDGEVWSVYLDPSSHLPALVDCRSADGQILEFYHFRDVQPNPVALATAEAFDPDARWGPARGLFGRLATRNEAPTSTTATR